MRLFGRLLFEPNLWHLNRRSVSGAFAAGLFWTMVPIPFQMIPATATAILFRINLPISIALVWISNPLTVPPIFYFAYRVGLWLLDQDAAVGEFEMSPEWLADSIELIWEPLLAGSLFVGTLLGMIGYTAIRLIWRWFIIRKYRRRQASRMAKLKGSESN